MMRTLYSCGGISFERIENSFTFHGPPDDVEKLFFYFENVASRVKSSKVRAVGLTGYLAGEASDVYY